jgi:uncharacterized protein (TIGR03067 family)
MLRSGLVCVTAALLLSISALSVEAQETKTGGLHAKLLGQWSYISGQRAGQAVDMSRLAGDVIFRKNDLTLPAGPSEQFLIAYSIDETKKPATIDLSIKDGPVKEGKSGGILKIEGDTLTLCYCFEGSARPEKFESTEDNGAHLFVLKRKTAMDVAKLPGDWDYTAGTRAGEKTDATRLQGTVSFTKETVTIPAGPDASFVMAYKIDASKTPATIDLEIKDGPVKEGKTKGIIKLEGDKLWICYSSEGGERPKDFTSTEKDGNSLFELKRTK